MSNYSILEENTLAGFSETAGCLYLKLLDVFQGDERRAFLTACRYEDEAGGVLDYIMLHGPVGPTGQLDPITYRELSRFMAERWRHNFMERNPK